MHSRNDLTHPSCASQPTLSNHAHAIHRNKPRRPASHAAFASIGLTIGADGGEGTTASTIIGSGATAKLDVGTTPPAMSVGSPQPRVSAESGCSCGSGA